MGQGLISSVYSGSVLWIAVWAVYTQGVKSDIQNDPDYPVEILDEDCKPFKDNDTGQDWNLRVLNLTEPGRQMYGYVRASDTYYEGKLNCAIKVVAPPGYRLVLRVPRVEIYHDDTGCDYDYMSVIGATDQLHYCGFGQVPHSISSTANWLIFRFVTSEWDADHGYLGFSLYYTAQHTGPCNSTEWKCHKTDYCIPNDVKCDDRDNCGNWADERVRLCGMSKGAIVAVSVVCVLVGGSILFFVGYCIYNKHKSKRLRQQRQREIRPTRTVERNSSTGTNSVTITPSGPPVSSRQAEPPPPYTPVAYINIGLFANGEPANPDAVQEQNGTAQEEANRGSNAHNGIGSISSANVNVRFTHASGMRPAMGEPPPLYSQSSDTTTGNNTSSEETNGANTDANQASGVSFEPLPEKET